MSPDVKEALDYLLAFAGPGAAGGALLLVLGWLKARSERPHIAQPQVGGGALAQIGGMVMGQQTAQDIIEALQGISASHDRCTLTREAEMQMRKRISDERHEEHRQIIDVLRTLADRMRDMPHAS